MDVLLKPVNVLDFVEKQAHIYEPIIKLDSHLLETRHTISSVIDLAFCLWLWQHQFLLNSRSISHQFYIVSLLIMKCGKSSWSSLGLLGGAVK